jgi:hypothetical protein
VHRMGNEVFMLDVDIVGCEERLTTSAGKGPPSAEVDNNMGWGK